MTATATPIRVETWDDDEQGIHQIWDYFESYGEFKVGDRVTRGTGKTVYTITDIWVQRSAGFFFGRARVRLQSGKSVQRVVIEDLHKA